MPPQEPVDVLTNLVLQVVGIAIMAFMVAGYSLIATWTLRRVGSFGLVGVALLTATMLSGAFFLLLGDRLLRVPSLASMLVLILVLPVFTTAGTSTMIWRLHRRLPEASLLRYLGHGLAGFVLGVFAVLLAACGQDIARLL